MYLNQIYFGEGRWGVQEAARAYFGKNVQESTLPEAALIAGLPKAPTHYSPLKNKEKAFERRNLVLSVMREQNYITDSMFKQAKFAPLILKKENDDDFKGKFASYVDYVIEEAVTVYGFTEQQILTGGLHIFTRLDPSVQNAIEQVYKDHSYFPESPDDQLAQSGTVVLDPYSGGIRGMVGHRGDHVFRGFNHATQLRRQPGSVFKPLIVYAPALEKGYTPFSRLYDDELDINGYRPKDWDNHTRGQVSLHEAVVYSWNIPAVWLLNEIGMNTGMDFVKKSGIPLSGEDRNLGIALGGLSEGVSPLQMAQAYSIFPNLGKMNKAHAITKITTRDGHPLIETKMRPIEVMNPSNAYLMTMLLQDVISKGTGKEAALKRPTAGKTGTTQLPDSKQFAGINGAKDVWFVGYTPELVAAVWIGYDQTDQQHYLTTYGGAYPATVFREILSLALRDVPVANFQPPKDSKVNQEQSDQQRGKKKKKEDD